MRRFRKTRPKGGSSSRRRKNWERQFVAETFPLEIIGPGATFADAQWVRAPADTFGSNAGIDDQIEVPEDWTLVRNITSIVASAVNATESPTGVFFFAAAIIVWEATSQLPPSPLDIPFPILDGDADWIWHWSYPVPMLGVGAAGTVFSGSNLLGGGLLDKQTLARRKLSSKQGLLLCTQFDNTFGTGTINQPQYGAFNRGLFLES